MWSGVGMVSEDVPGGGGGGATPDDKHLIHLHWKMSKKGRNWVMLHFTISTFYTTTRATLYKHLYTSTISDFLQISAC